jgi:hypothetical protein
MILEDTAQEMSPALGGLRGSRIERATWEERGDGTEQRITLELDNGFTCTIGAESPGTAFSVGWSQTR